MAIKEKEKILMVVEENIPDELKQYKQWVLWKAIWNEQRKQYEKVPYQVNGEDKASVSEESTWGTFDAVINAYEHGISDGIGYVITDKDPYSCIDGDDIQNVDDLPPLAQEIVDLSCAEISPSQTGIHVWVRFSRKNETHGSRNRKLGFELYSTGRFMTVTGETINDLPINEGPEINAFIDKVFKHEESKQQVQLPQGGEGRGKAVLPEADIIRIALKSKKGERFNAFLNGGWEKLTEINEAGEMVIAYPSPSEARMGFLNDLAFYTNCDYVMMNSVFEKSSLMDEKWSRPQKKTTLGDEELQKAIRECKDTFKPQLDDFQLIIQENDSFVFPKGYVSKNGCLYNIVEKKDRSGEIEELEVLICRQTPIITRSFMNVEHPQLYHELTWSDKGKVYKEVIPAGDLAIKKELLKLSYKSLAVTDNNAKNLITYFDRLCMVNNLDHEYLVERLGHIKNTFVHPLAASGVKILPPDIGEKQLVEAFQTSGTTEEWVKHVFEPIKKHPKALLMVLASFTSVLLQDLKMKPFIVDLSGVTSQGKTTVLRACASVWGNEYLVSEWSLTKVAAERKAAFLNSFPIILDDTRKADEKQLQSFIYNFSGGRSRGRGSLSGSQREYTWGNLLLSTGEDSLNAYAERAGGVAARILPITGLPFQGENYQFYTDLYNAIENYYGSIGLEFLNQWREKKKTLLPHFAKYNDVFQKKSQGNEVIGRIARYYAAIIFTGRLLNDFFGLEIDLMQLYRLFDELNAENKAVDKPIQLLEAILSDLDADRGAIFNNYFEPRSGIKAVYKNDSLHLLPAYLKEFLKSEEKTIRSEWLRREITVPQVSKGKTVDYKQVKHKGRNFSGVPIEQKIVEELGFDFSEEIHA